MNPIKSRHLLFFFQWLLRTFVLFMIETLMSTVLEPHSIDYRGPTFTFELQMLWLRSIFLLSISYIPITTSSSPSILHLRGIYNLVPSETNKFKVEFLMQWWDEKLSESSRIIILAFTNKSLPCSLIQTLFSHLKYWTVVTGRLHREFVKKSSVLLFAPYYSFPRLWLRRPLSW